MIFYSLIGLFLYVNRYFEKDDLLENKLLVPDENDDPKDRKTFHHPAQFQGAEKALFFKWIEATKRVLEGRKVSQGLQDAHSNSANPDYINDYGEIHSETITKIHDAKVNLLHHLRAFCAECCTEANIDNQQEKYNTCNAIFSICLSKMLCLCFEKESHNRVNESWIIEELLGEISKKNA